MHKFINKHRRLKPVTCNRSRIIDHGSLSGFTLIEAIVATALFAFVVSSIIGVYMATLRLDTRTKALRGVNQNARFIMDYLEKEITNGHIDYASFPGQNAFGTTDLYLINQSNEAEHIALSGTNLTLSKSVNGNPATTNLNSTGIKVTNLKFLVSPNTDPLTSINPGNEQPHVTVVLELTSAYNTRDVVKLDLQSTYSEMYYPSRQ